MTQETPKTTLRDQVRAMVRKEAPKEIVRQELDFILAHGTAQQRRAVMGAVQAVYDVIYRQRSERKPAKKLNK